MTLWQAVLGFAVMAAVVTVTPGLDTVLVLRQALRDRRQVAFATALGITVGALLWGFAAAAGLAALFVASEVAFNVLRVAGVGYLVWVAWGYLRAAVRGERAAVQVEAPAVRMGVLEAFGRGLLTDLLNPKMAVFYLTVLPLFLPAGLNPVAVGTSLAGIHAVEAMIWFTVVILGAHSVRRFLDSRRGARVVDGVAGTAMAGFALVLAVDNH
ncbi:MAG: LysE family translocator [Propionicimonas sp.]|uniref:LysE family translocator n=1 Tax=Propionicimonas sp. TaxID=1955623 RepID=UPI002B2149C8|nr:LysE family translocator [Propionicimonas sp.]MEA4943502.1 LysE family translocator [Propionicimonas sp.]MEA5055666.1 LysE family translocator [Propionicimonas sp.]MEA5115997.1 LysE family translocator [Propionicimonas sp.]